MSYEIYFIEAKEVRRCKIGYSSNIERRISSMKIESPVELELIGTIQTETPKKLERIIHSHLQEFHFAGEWFEIDREYVKTNLLERHWGTCNINCANCGKEYEFSKKSMYCSDACRQSAYRKRRRQGEVIETNNNSVAGQSYKRSGFLSVCEHCKIEYIAKRESSKYCSGLCRLAAWKRKHYESEI